MIFSERQKLEKEYYKWLEKNKNVLGSLLDVLTFLDNNGNLVKKEEKSNVQILQIAFEMVCRDLLSLKNPKIDYTEYKPKSTMKSYIHKAEKSIKK
jgi:glutaredoxin 2